MNTRILILALAASFSFAAIPVLAVEGHSHGAHAEAARGPTLNEGRKWATDANLRRSMTEIRNALELAHGGTHDRVLTPAQYQALARTLEGHIASIVGKCRLEPAADADLRVILAELNAAAGAFKAPTTVESSQALQRAAMAANTYGKHFDHPGWKSL